jgi:ribosomal protein S10
VLALALLTGAVAPPHAARAEVIATVRVIKPGVASREEWMRARATHSREIKIKEAGKQIVVRVIEYE